MKNEQWCLRGLSTIDFDVGAKPICGQESFVGRNHTFILTVGWTSGPPPAAVRESARAPRSAAPPRGLKPIQIWVSDVGSGTLAHEAHRRSLLVGSADQHFVVAVSEWPEERAA